MKRASLEHLLVIIMSSKVLLEAFPLDFDWPLVCLLDYWLAFGIWVAPVDYCGDLVNGIWFFFCWLIISQKAKLHSIKGYGCMS